MFIFHILAQKVKLEQKAKEKASKENEKPCEVPYLLPWLNPNYPLTVPVQQSDCEWGQWISVDADNQHVNRDAADLSPPQSYHSLNDFDDPLEVSYI
uniref:Uncharacterized protein n=1 Tax=Panagrolaimus superbus TaxID=310955 RepID=A0A914Y7F5_9BILA